MSMTFRRGTIADAHEIAHIWDIICAERIYTVVNKPFTPEQEKNYIASLYPREGIFIAEIDNKIVAFQSLDLWTKYTDTFDHVGILGTFIIPEWRKKGIGRKLTDYTISFARNHGYEKLVIYVRGSNTAARVFYKKLGFIPKGVLEKQVKIDELYDDEVFMELLL